MLKRWGNAMLADGRLRLSGVAKLVPHLTDANSEDVLTRAAHKTKSQVEELIAAIAPKPDVPAAVRQLPMRRETGSTGELGPDRVAALHDAPMTSSIATSSPPMPELGLDRPW